MDKTYYPESGQLLTRRWMVVYTRSKYEKKVDQLLKLKNIQSFCPLVKSRRRWADRYKMVEAPLFTSYVFVCINVHEHLPVLQTVGVVGFVNYCNKPAVVPFSDIEHIRGLLQKYEDIESVSLKSLRIGDQVKVKNGIFFDYYGEILEIHGKSILILMKQLDCALIAKIKVNSDQVFLNRDSIVAS